MNRAVLFQNMLSTMAAATGKPLLYGPDNRPLAPTSEYGIRRLAAKRTGSMKNWVPARLLSRDQEARDREDIVRRCIDLSQNDPNAAGIIDNIAGTVIGSGLMPYPAIEWKLLGIEKEMARQIQRAQLSAYLQWTIWADAGERMNFGQIQYLTKNHLVRYGEYFVLCLMLDDPARPFSLALLVIDPQRVKTPVDLLKDGRIRDGVEMGEYGQPVAFWVKKSLPGNLMAPDTSANFLRIPARIGHRWNMIHRFVIKDAEAVRGYPVLTPLVKQLRDYNDLLDAELVSNVVTAALTYFIEDPAGAPWELANSFTTDTESNTINDDTAEQRKRTHYEETWPGRILYGNQGEKPHLLSADRPGVTFEPFVRLIRKTTAGGINWPYPILFKDPDGLNFAALRWALLDVWRVVTMDREWHAGDLCQPIWRMLQEEAWLRRYYKAPRFYARMHLYTHSSWLGSPKGDVEPVKAAQADILLNGLNSKTKRRIAYEHGSGDWFAVVDDIEEETEVEKEKNLYRDPDANSPSVTKATLGSTEEKDEDNDANE